MLDDQRAEHVPGCNMAFKRSTLLGLGGFDVQFRQAGDDVDVCWRLLDAGFTIGYAPAALVWHHRRTSIRAYFKQQEGYGRSEAMLQLKHPGRFNRLGYSQWLGVIYGEGSVGLPVRKPTVYHGKFGEGLFQCIYRRNDYTAWAYFTLFEWHMLALMVSSFAFLWRGSLAIAAGMWTLTLITSIRACVKSVLPKGAPIWCRPLVFVMHLLQPVVRAWHRYKYRWNHAKIPKLNAPASADCIKSISFHDHDLYFNSKEALGREHLLAELVKVSRDSKWHGDFSAEWDEHDVELLGDGWHDIRLRSATEELGWPKRFTRVRCTLRPAPRGVTLFVMVSLWLGVAILLGNAWTIAIGSIAFGATLAALWRSRRLCRDAVSRLVYQSAIQARLEPVGVRVAVPDEPAKLGSEDAEVCLD
jgi:hypothetical protein